MAMLSVLLLKSVVTWVVLSVPRSFKKKRDLSTAEMVGQILVVDEVSEMNPDRHVTHVVVMGTGEPFDNYDNVIRLLE